MEDNIKYGDWVYLKSNPDIRIKVTLINPNNIVDFREQRTEEPKSAYLHELEKITDEELIIELEFTYQQLQSNRHL